MAEYAWDATRTSDKAPVKLGLSGSLIAPYTDSTLPAPTIPVNVNVVQIGDALLRISAVNPSITRNSFPGSRAADELIMYTYGAITRTNQYGVEIVCAADGTVLTINNRQAVGKLEGTTFGAGEYVLSGHGKMAEALLTASVGDKVVLGSRTEPTTPDEEDPTTPLPDPLLRTSNISVWVMLWPNSPKVDIGTLPLEVDEVRLSFLINDGQPVGDGPFGLASLKAQLTDFMKARKGRFCSAAVGGGGYTIYIPSVKSYTDNIKAAEKRWGVTFGGLNWDWEANAFRSNAANTIAVSRVFKKERGAGFYISWSPNGSFKNDYAQVCQSAPDAVDELEFQNYDTEVPYDTSLSITRSLMGMKIPKENMGSAMMIENGSAKRWTLQQCIDNTKRLRSDVGVRKVALWEGGRAQSAQWYKAMAGIVR